MLKREQNIKVFCKDMRKTILRMSLNAGSASSHFGGALSIVEIMSVLFNDNINLEKDRFILSKGHACLAYYSALFLKGKINNEQLNTFESDDSILPGHPVKHPEIGINFSNGSLGMGLSISVGIGIAFKKKNINNRIFTILGDGECNEGSVWEAVMSAPKFELDNLNLIIDRNNFQQTGSSKDIMDLGDLKTKLLSFNWEVDEIDGHNIKNLCKYFDSQKLNKKPKVLIAKTIKGKGFSFSENNNEWHHKILSKNIYENALKELSDN